MNGRTLKYKLAQLMIQHHVRPIERAPLSLSPATIGPQIIEGIAASSDVDADRMSFQRGSLSWPDDVSKIPLLLGHSDKVVGKILSLEYRDDGQLFVRARVDDGEAARLPALSVCATILESSVHAEDSTCFYFTIEKAVLDHIGLTTIPANACAIVLSRNDPRPLDDALAAAERFKKALAGLVVPQTPPPREHPEIEAGPAYIIGRLPAAILAPRRTAFRDVVARLPIGE